MMLRQVTAKTAIVLLLSLTMGGCSQDAARSKREMMTNFSFGADSASAGQKTPSKAPVADSTSNEINTSNKCTASRARR